MSDVLRTGISLLLQSTLLLSLGLTAAWLLRRRGPDLRAFVLQMTLMGVALGSVLSVSLVGHVQPVWTIPTVPTLPSPIGMGEGSENGPDSVAPTQGGTGTLPSLVPGGVGRSVGPEGVPPPSPLPAFVIAIWATGTSLLLLWLAFCQGHLTALRRRALPLTKGRAAEMLARLSASRAIHAPLLFSSPHVRSPFLAGVWRPAVFLPVTWETDYDDTALHVILAHELAHHTRRDCAWTLLLRLTTALLWPQPLLWLLGGQLDQAAEEACDLLALTPDCSPRRYADALLTLAESALPSRMERALGASVVPIRSAVGRRIQNVLDRRNLTMTTLSTRLHVGLTLGAATAAVSVLFLISVGAAPVAPDRAAAVVQQYLDSRMSGNEDAAYALLSSATRSLLPENPYRAGDDFAHHFTTHPSPTYTAAGALFYDTHNTLGATYTVVGTAPGNPNLVRVSVQMAGVGAPVLLNVGVIADAASGGTLKIDEALTFQNTDAAAYRILQSRQNMVISEEHLKQISLGIIQYTQDNNERFPDASHWADEISPYLVSSGVTGAERSRQLLDLFHDPSAPAGQTWSYAYNRALSHLSLAKLNLPAQVVMVFTSTQGIRNASDTGQSLPQPGWHFGGNVYAFTDGHVKYVKDLSSQHDSFQPSFSG